MPSMSSIPTTSSVNPRTSTEQTSINPSHNYRRGFPYACSCGGEINLASVHDQVSAARLCYVCEYIGEGGDHIEKLFDEAVREEIQWSQKQIIDHEDRLSRVERNIPQTADTEFSRELTKIYGMVKSLREDLELLHVRYCSNYEQRASSPSNTGNRVRQALTWFSVTKHMSCVLSVTLGFLVGYYGHRNLLPIITGQRS